MCDKCRTYPAAFDTSYGMDPQQDPQQDSMQETKQEAAPNMVPDAEPYEEKYAQQHGTAVANAIDTTGGFPTELDADMHDTATVENTTELIADLEQQLTKMTEKKDDYLEGVRIVARAFRASKRENAALREQTRVAYAERDAARRGCNIMRSDNAKLVAEGNKVRDYVIGLVLRLTQTKLTNAELYGHTVSLNRENDRLRATIDYMKRPFYQRWAISLRARLLLAAGEDGGE